MNLLIITQKVDKNDDVLGFFHGWIEEFAKHCQNVTVICLYEGMHDLPKNVRVLSLGKEHGVSRIKYLTRFYRFIWQERTNYDSVFVHMNPEYVVLGGLLWRMWGKTIGLWYMHKSVDLKLRIAEKLAHHIFSGTKESFRFKSSKLHVMGHGIDTHFFSPDPTIKRGAHLLSVGRLMSIKHHDEVIRVAKEETRALRIAGSGTERDALKALASELGVEVTFLGPLSQKELRDEYRKAARLVHRSQTGSLDKVVLEAAASGCVVDTSDPATSKLPLSVEYVRTHHALQSLVPAILSLYEKNLA